MSLPSDPKERKNVPMARGLLDYFPDALACVADVSRVGNEQHNPGQPMHWAKHLSTDHADCIIRHLVDRGKCDTDGLRHSAKVAWRALALLQTELEEQQPVIREIDILQRVEQKAAEKEIERLCRLGGFDVCTDTPTMAFHHCDHCKKHLACQSYGGCIEDDHA